MMPKIIGAGFLVLLLYSMVFSVSVKAAPVISEGIYIEEMDVSGLTKRQAKEMEKNYLKGLLETEVTVYVGEQKAAITLAELGYQYDQMYADNAAKLGREGNLIKRYMEAAKAQEESFVYEHSFSLDAKLIRQFVLAECTKYNVKAENAKLHQKKDGSLRVVSSKSGSKVVVDETAEKIRRTILEDWDKSSELVISAIVTEDMPVFTTETARECTDLLGSFTTAYLSSGESRCKNIENAAKLINGTVLFPGQEFSMYGTLHPISKENGFEKAGSFSDGKVVNSVGGGICQATTTLYNAVLWAELEVTQRNPHSLAVKYVEPGMDAAIAGTYKDLKFKNSVNAPVYIEAVTEDKTITFRIWGKESRPEGRQIEYKTNILETIEPGEDVVAYDPELPKGTGYITQEPYTGYKVELYKIIKTKGTGDRRELVSTSEYAAAPRYVTAGSKGNKKQENTSEAKGSKDEADSVDGLKHALSQAAEVSGGGVDAQEIP